MIIVFQNLPIQNGQWHNLENSHLQWRDRAGITPDFPFNDLPQSGKSTHFFLFTFLYSSYVPFFAPSTKYNDKIIILFNQFGLVV